MSTGARITLANAMQVVEHLQQSWPGLEVVGSIRRRLATVGDIEFVAAAPDVDLSSRIQLDPLFSAINENMANPWRKEARSLFESPPDAPGEVLGSIERGLKPGFLAASLSITPWPGCTIPCQIYRYSRDNRGWVKLMRTGPTDFGMWFLGRWKYRYGIGTGQASINGHLVTAKGVVIPVATEEEALSKCGLPWIDPECREEYLRHQTGGARKCEVGR